MALHFERETAESMSEPYVVGEHLYLTEDRGRVVPEGDPAGRWLWASPGTEVPRSEAVRLGAIQEPAKPAAAAEVKEQAKPADKARAKPADKARNGEPAKIRAWAAQQPGMKVPPRGPIPQDVVDAYRQAHEE